MRDIFRSYQHNLIMDRRKIRLTFVATGESVLAEMLDDEAPEVCRIVWDLLPVETRAIHGMYSGAEVFALLDNPQPVPPEGLTQLPLPGEILYFYDESKNVTNSARRWRSCASSITAASSCAGRKACRRTPASSPASPATGNTTGLPFRDACRKARWEGPPMLRIERA